MPQTGLALSSFLVFLSLLSYISGVEKPAVVSNPANPTNYYKADRGVGTIRYIIIHDTQESYNITQRIFLRNNSVAAHYVINNHLSIWPEDKQKPDGEITQMVQDKDVGYHVKGANPYTIGIEHIGWIDDKTLRVKGGFSLPMYKKSAQLTAYLTQTYQIGVNRSNIIGHGECKLINCTSDHVDPGLDWDWDLYLSLVRGNINNECVLPKYSLDWKGRDITTIQHLLNALGDKQYSCTVTGKLDAQTQAAIQKLKTDKSIPADKDSNLLVDENLWRYLLSPWGYAFMKQTNYRYNFHMSLEFNQTSSVVTAIQFLLKERYYHNVNVTGYLDAATMNAFYLLRKMNQLMYTTYPLLLDRDGWHVLIAGCAPSRDYSMAAKVVLASLLPTLFLLFVLFGITVGIYVYKRRRDKVSTYTGFQDEAVLTTP